MKAIYLKTAGAIALTAGIAACVSSPEPAPAPAPAPVAAPAPAPAPVQTIATPEYANYLDAPQTAGTWFYERRAGQTRAVFGQNVDAAKFLITCDTGSRAIAMVRADSPARERLARVRTETATRALSFMPMGSANVLIGAQVPSNDPLLDAIAITKGRFAVETAGKPTLYLPAWVEVTRVIEDCR
ncbi:hypothetical protein N9D37_00690 [Erythrobacter sp.]|nr:hypothetical protein [Erythrobacter sp.]